MTKEELKKAIEALKAEKAAFEIAKKEQEELKETKEVKEQENITNDVQERNAFLEEKHAFLQEKIAFANKELEAKQALIKSGGDKQTGSEPEYDMLKDIAETDFEKFKLGDI